MLTVQVELVYKRLILKMNTVYIISSNYSSYIFIYMWWIVWHFWWRVFCMTHSPRPYFGFLLHTSRIRLSPRPVFRGAVQRSSPSHAALHVPSVSSELATAQISPATRRWSFFFFPPPVWIACDFQSWTHIGVLKSARWCVIAHKPFFFLSWRCASVPMDWFEYFPRPSWENGPCNLRLSFKLHVSPARFESACFRMIVGLRTFFLVCAFYRRRPGIVKKDFYIWASPGFPKPAKIYLWKSDGRAGSSVAPLSPLSHLSVLGVHGGEACRQR